MILLHSVVECDNVSIPIIDLFGLFECIVTRGCNVFVLG